MLRTFVLILSAAAAFFGTDVALCEPQPRKPATLDEKLVAGIVADPATHYVAGVIQVRASCSMHCGDACFDRVEIVDLIAQAPLPSEQLAVGSQFHLHSALSEPSTIPDPAPRFLVTVRQLNSYSCSYTPYAATSMGPPDKDSVESLRSAFKAVLGE